MKRFVLIAGFVFSDLLFFFFTWQFFVRFTRSYGETGKSFSEMDLVVYRQESLLAYGILASFFLLASFALFLWLRKT